MRNCLNCCAKVFAFALFFDNGLVNAAGGYVVDFSEACVGKSFVMAQIKVSFCAVIGYENFAVLKRAHCARVNVYVGIKFLDYD